MTDTTVLDAAQVTAPAAPLAAERAHGIDRMLALEVPVSVCFGEREIAIRDLAALAPGSILELDRDASAPVDLMVNGQVVARGALLVVDEHYALRVTEVVGDGERIQTLGSPRR